MSILYKDFCLTKFMTFFPRIVNLALEKVLLHFWQNLLVSYVLGFVFFFFFFFDKIFCLSPLSVQEMLTGQRLCQSSSHNDAVLAALNQQRSDGILCDITLIAEEQKFHAHKAVLAACSDYFRVSPKTFFCLFVSYNNTKNYPRGAGGGNGPGYDTEQTLNLSLWKIQDYCTFSRVYNI